MGFGNSETAEMLKLSSWQVGAEICRAGSSGQEAEPRNSEDPSLEGSRPTHLQGGLHTAPRGPLSPFQILTGLILGDI